MWGYSEDSARVQLVPSFEPMIITSTTFDSTGEGVSKVNYHLTQINLKFITNLINFHVNIIESAKNAFNERLAL